MHAQLPYWRLSAFYLFYFAALGTLIPYWSLYLKDLGFSAREIGELMAIVMVTKVVAPNLWGWVADHVGRPMRIVRLGSLLALLCYLWIFVVEGFWAIALVMFCFSFFWNGILPQFESVTLNLLGKQSDRYSHVRVWGSIGFILAVLVLGELLEEVNVALVPQVLALLYLAIWLNSMLVGEQIAQPHHEQHAPLRQVLRTPAVVALLLAAMLMQMSHGPYYTFYTIYMESHGYSRGVIGQLWALGVLAEVGIFLIMHRLIGIIGLRILLVVSFALTALRWILIGVLPDLWFVVLFAQLLHAASFGVFHAVSIALIHQYFKGRNHGKGQALYASFSFGIGGAVGSYYSGLSWEVLGAMSSYLIAAVMALIGWWLVWRWVYGEEKRFVQP